MYQAMVFEELSQQPRDSKQVARAGCEVEQIIVQYYLLVLNMKLISIKKLNE